MAGSNPFADRSRSSEPGFLDGVSGTRGRYMFLAKMPRNATSALPVSGMGAFVADPAGDGSLEVRGAKLISGRS